MDCPDLTIFGRGGQMSKAPRTNFVPGKNRTNIGEMKKWTDTVTQTCILTCLGRSQYIQQDIKGVAMHSKMFSKVGNSSVGVVNLKPRLEDCRSMD